MMNQIGCDQVDLFAQAKEDTKVRRRISGNISGVILSFCKERMLSDRHDFTMNELEEYVNRQHHITAGSAGRILRELKLIGRVQYDVKDRSRALYCSFSVS